MTVPTGFRLLHQVLSVTIRINPSFSHSPIEGIGPLSFADRHPLADGLSLYLSPAAWKCSMIWSAYLGLPLSLESAGAVLGLSRYKLAYGKQLLRYFTMPCKPSAANGGRTRNLPRLDSEKWRDFIAYNRRDVEAEMEIEVRLYRYPVPDAVWEEYHLDQEINNWGILLDRALRGRRCSKRHSPWIFFRRRQRRMRGKCRNTTSNTPTMRLFLPKNGIWFRRSLPGENALAGSTEKTVSSAQNSSVRIAEVFSLPKSGIPHRNIEG